MARKSATKSAGGTPPVKRTPAARTKTAKKTKPTPAPDSISDSHPVQSSRGTIVDLNISVLDNEDYTCSKEGEETNIVGNEECSNADSLSVEVKAQLQKDVNSEKYGVEGPKTHGLLNLEKQPEEDFDDEEDPEESPEEIETLDEKNIELEAVAKHQKQSGIEKAKEEETNITGNEEHSKADSVTVEAKGQLQKDVNPEIHGVDGPKSGGLLDHGEQESGDLDDEEDPEEPRGETETLKDEHMDLEAIAKQENESGLEKAQREEANIIGNEEHSNAESISAEIKAQLQKDVNPEKQGVEGPASDEMLDLGEQEREDLDDEDDPEESPEETETLEEHMELEAIAKQQKIKKEHEIFVGGLDHDATEEDLRKVFQRIGEVVEVRLHINSSTNKNKGYAFVKFASKEHAKKALSEMKNPVIHGKRCGTAPSEDNDTLFLGNICNTWTKEAIKQKLKDYGIEGVENITLVPDVQHKGLSRGFAFLEFSSHADAMIAYKRLQKPDVVFGHVERTAKVAFADPVREPDPMIMAQVKSVFINGLPPHWDEDHVREMIKSYGEIVRIVLARNMPTAKRKDYGFVDFSTHEAAVACVDGINKSELGDGASKIKARARLSNPLPKTQVVKGGMCGGFRIGQARSGTFPRSGRGFGRGRQPFNNRGNFNRGRGRSFYHRGGHSQMGRMGFGDDRDFNMYPDFHGRQFGPRGAMRGGHHPSSRGAAFAGPSIHYADRTWYGNPDMGPGEPIPPRRPYSPGGQFDGPGPFLGRHIDDSFPGRHIDDSFPGRHIDDPFLGRHIDDPFLGRHVDDPFLGRHIDDPFLGRHIDDPYLYDENMRGMKRPFYMTDPEPGYMGPNRLRPRMDYANPSTFPGTQYHDYVGAGSRQYPHDYYGSDHGGGSYSSFYGGHGPHGHGYYY